MKLIRANIDLIRRDGLDATFEQMDHILDRFIDIVEEEGFSCYSSWGLKHDVPNDETSSD